MTFVEAAYQILKQRRRPLSAIEITNKALESGLISTKGKRPAATMWTALYHDIGRCEKTGGRSRFVRLQGNLWGLAEW